MSKLRRAAALLGLTAIVALLGAPAASAGGDDDSELVVETIDVASFPEVTLTVSLPAGLAGQEVPADAFGLKENGSDREVRSNPVGSSGLAVVVVIDTSGSMQGAPIVSAKSAALNFVERLPEDARVAIVGFSDDPKVVAGFTTDRAAIANAIDSLSASGETALNDGLLSAVGLLEQAGDAERSIVLLSDGGDTVSTAPIEQVERRLEAANTGLTAIELTTGETDRAALDRIAAAAGGRVVSVDDPRALDATYAAIAERLSNLYELHFTSSGAPRADLTVSVNHDGVQSSVLEPVTWPDRPVAPTETTVPEIEAAQSFTEGSTLLDGWVLLVVGFAFIIVGALIAGLIAFGPREPARRLAEEYEGTGAGDADGGAWIQTVAQQAAAVGEQIAARGGQNASIDARLDAAGLSLRAGELIALVAAASLGSAIFGFLLFGPVGLLVGLVLPAALTPAVLNYLRDRRRRKFGDQLGDTLVLLSASLRAGYGLVQAADAVARETDDPMASEFGRVVTESRLGRDLTDALHGVVERTGSEDFEWVVEAIEIHREVGGDLTEVLDHVGETIRARTRIQRQVAALSAEGKISAFVLMGLPFAIGLFIWVTNPEYLEPLWDTTSGKLMLVGTAGLLVAGGLWLKRIVRPEF